MASDYSFLTDHSYSLRPDNDKLPLNPSEMKYKKRRGPSTRKNKATPATNRTVSIDRSSSDKENNSSSLTNVSISTINIPKNKNKKKTTGSRLSARASIANSRTPSTKKQLKIQSSIIKKKKMLVKNQTKPLIFHQLDAPPSLSIEERVKLRRTTPFLKPTKSLLSPKMKHIRLSKPRKNIIKPKKFFLGSGLDLDNIVLGNRRSAQT